MRRLREAREQAHLNQKSVAASLGIAPPSVANWESGKTNPSLENLIQLADLYGVTVDYLLGREDEVRNAATEKIVPNTSLMSEVQTLKNDEKRDLLGYIRVTKAIKESREIGNQMTINEYQSLAMRTLNPDLDKRDVLINGVMGLCGESGEAIDLVKKHLHQGHPLDRAGIVKELGDIAWYLAETAYALDVDLETVLQGNIDKLRRRYPEGFGVDQSINRTE